MKPNASLYSKSVLTIAGSDPSGGAGIQADIKTFTTLGVYGSAAITCLTAQNTLGVDSYLPVDPSFVKKQIDLVLEDIKPSHIKIGMVGNVEIARAISSSIKGFTGEIIYDPVLKASTGQALYKTDEIEALAESIINKASVLTPNTNELQILTQLDCSDEESIKNAAQKMFNYFPNLKVLAVTGGHFDENAEEVVDFLFIKDKDSKQVLKKNSHPRIKSKNTHGTGCTFASAFTAYHLLTENYETAFNHAVSLLQELITASADKPIGSGNGPLLHHLHKDN